MYGTRSRRLTTARYISIAAPKQRECVPILLGSKPRQAPPMVAQADQSDAIIWQNVICSHLSWRQTMQTEVSSVVPGYVQIWLTRRTHCRTGHKTGLSVWPWMTVSCFWSFFCISKVTATLSANSKLSNNAKRRRPSLKNLIFLRQRSFVLFISLLGTFKYLQEWQAKKAALIVSCTMALSRSVTCLLASSLRKQVAGPFVAPAWDPHCNRPWIVVIEGC